MKLTDTEIAILIDSLHFTAGELGSSIAEDKLLQRLKDEFADRGYTWIHENGKSVNGRLLDELAGKERA